MVEAYPCAECGEYILERFINCHGEPPYILFEIIIISMHMYGTLTPLPPSPGYRYHPQCVKCAVCSKLLQGQQFSLEEDGPTCTDCWAAREGVICAGCNKAIVPDETGMGRYTVVNDRNYHMDCLKCEDCGLKFGEGVPGPFRIGEAMLCKEDAQKRKRVRRGV
jgi:hypothetical protein